jgi:transcriptional regulator with XRE-family HTH domain
MVESNRNCEPSVPKKQANSIDKHVGSQIRARRITRGMSQEKLAKLLGLTFQQVQKYEKGVNRIGAGRLFDVARILDVGILYFYDGLVKESSGRPGFAEDESPAPVPAAPAAETAQLLAAFTRIHDPKVRRRILDLVKSLADSA